MQTADSTLSAAILYPLNPVTMSFATEHSLSLAAAQVLERECKRFLWATWFLSQASVSARSSEGTTAPKELEWIVRYWQHFFDRHLDLYREYCLKQFKTVLLPPETLDDLQMQFEYLSERASAAGQRNWSIEIQELA